MLGLLSTVESGESEKFEKVAVADLYQTRINTRAPYGANESAAML